MRRIGVLLVLLLLAGGLSAQSVVISQDKLDELTKILASYMQITEKLSASLTNSEKRINDLETGFTAYKQIVDLELIPKAKALERQVGIIRIGVWTFGIIAAGEAVYIAGHLLKWW